MTGGYHAIASKNECTHDVKAGLSLRWCTWDFFCLIDAFMFHLNEPRLEKTAQLVNYIVQFLSFPNLIFHGSRRLLKLYSTILMDLVGNPKADRFFRCVATDLNITKCNFVCSFLTFVHVNKISSTFSIFNFFNSN